MSILEAVEQDNLKESSLNVRESSLRGITYVMNAHRECSTHCDGH